MHRKLRRLWYWFCSFQYCRVEAQAVKSYVFFDRYRFFWWNGRLYYQRVFYF